MKPTLTHYPRPRMKRMDWKNLNGTWNFELNTTSEPFQNVSDSINVPYCVESLDSGLGWRVEPQHYMHYQRKFMLDAFNEKRVILHFGAVDQTVDIYINKNHVANHSGGYASFSIDITDTVYEGENEIYCTVNDRTEMSPLTRGKQRLNNRGSMKHIFYTPTSGIWQTVWIEIIPQKHIQDITIEPDFDQRSVVFNIQANCDLHAQLKIHIKGALLYEGIVNTNSRVTIPIPNMLPWSPEEPNLYSVEVHMGDDSITSYFAMRKVSVIRDASGILRFALNNKPYFMSGVLDQGYWPTSLLTPPSDEALQYDIETMKKAGFNTLRKHVKVEVEHFYYLCDMLGMLVWQDMPNGGSDYHFSFVTYLPNISDFISRHIRDTHYTLFGRKDTSGRALFYKELESMIHQLKHYPSIIAWVPFNEGWGQFDAARATSLIRSIDSTRLINEACGWFDQGGGDMYTYHSYFKPLKVKPRNRVVALTEFGGQALVIEGHVTSDRNFGYKMLDTKTANDALRKQIEQKVIANVQHGLSASIYTQLSDVSSEVNGLLTYDRDVFKFDMIMIQELNKNIQEIFESVTTASNRVGRIGK